MKGPLSNRASQSVAFNSGQKMALRAFYLIGVLTITLSYYNLKCSKCSAIFWPPLETSGALSFFENSNFFWFCGQGSRKRFKLAFQPFADATLKSLLLWKCLNCSFYTSKQIQIPSFSEVLSLFRTFVSFSNFFNFFQISFTFANFVLFSDFLSLSWISSSFRLFFSSPNFSLFPEKVVLDNLLLPFQPFTSQPRLMTLLQRRYFSNRAEASGIDSKTDRMRKWDEQIFIWLLSARHVLWIS